MVPVRSWKACDKVHINHLPLSFWKFYILSQSFRSWVLYFHLLAIWSLGNKFNNVPSSYLPKNVPLSNHGTSWSKKIDELNVWSY